MSTELLVSEFCCAECNEYFNSASNLLTHFALHASQVNKQENTDKISQSNDLLLRKSEKKCVPDLYPINISKTKYYKSENDTNSAVDLSIPDKYLVSVELNNDLYDINKLNCNGNNSNVQIDVDSDFNPLKYCSISMEIKDPSNITKLPKEKKYTVSDGSTRKKYPCSFCTKIFGWSTDLKRHVLVHTGERPFKCKICDASFTRNFLLQKHKNKVHLNNTETKLVSKSKSVIPNLEPIQSVNINGVKVKDSRKQDKQKIKRNCFFNSNTTKNEEFCGLLRSQLNFMDKETIVQ